MKYYYLIDILGLIVLYFIFVYDIYRNNKRELFLKTTFYIYLGFVAFFTLMPIIISIPLVNTSSFHFNIYLIPFYDFFLGTPSALSEFILNIIMTIPFGILIPFIYKKNAVDTVKTTFLFSVLIEFLQLFSFNARRCCDITDLMTNTLGGVLGYTFFLLFYKPAYKFLDLVFQDKKSNITYQYNKKYNWIIILLIIILIIKSILIVYI